MPHSYQVLNAEDGEGGRWLGSQEQSKIFDRNILAAPDNNYLIFDYASAIYYLWDEIMVRDRRDVPHTR